MPDRFSITDEAHMRRALQLARRQEGRVEPNPMVGCVLVRNGRIIGEGAHRRFGGPHAEINALEKCAEVAKGATAYVTLEPCCYVGKTPPCTNALISAGISRVIAATQDPNPRVSGKGLRALRAAGISVSSGLFQSEADDLIAPFAKRMKSGRPWVILKWAQSIDGAIATRSGDSKWISDEIARAHAHRVRGRVDAIAVGVNTVLRDDPLLTCRAARSRRIAKRIVLDSHLRMPPTTQLSRTTDQAPVLVFCLERASKRRERELRRVGCNVLRMRAVEGRPSLEKILDYLGESEAVTNLLVEGGGTLLGRLMDERLADEVQVYIAPLLLGGEATVRAIRGRGVNRIADGPRMVQTQVSKMGGGWFLRGLFPKC